MTEAGAPGQVECATVAALATRFVQADCQATGLPDGSVHLRTSTMLIHEMPRPALELGSQLLGAVEKAGYFAYTRSSAAQLPFAFSAQLGHHGDQAL